MTRHLITGSDDGDNLLQADDRDDLLYGYGGADNINTGNGNDLIYAGADMDYVVAREGDDRAFGGDGSDVLSGGAGNDTLRGEAGADALVGGSGQDWLYGGDDGDSLFSNGSTTGFEDKHLFGGAGNDRLVFNWNDDGEAAGGAGQDELDLTAYDLAGTEAVTVSMIGKAGSASFGTFRLDFTGIEMLRLQTGAGDDSVTSGAGNDVLSVDLGANHVDAGDGDDLVAYHSGSANVLEGGFGVDVLEVVASSDVTPLVFSAAGAVSDGFGSTLTGFEQFVIRGWVLDDQAVLGGGADQFYGLTGDDTVSGGSGHDALRGQRGNDLLQGNGGADLLLGGDGQDVLQGGAGNDTLTGGPGADTLTGGAGADRFRFVAPEENFDHVTDFVAGLDKLVFYRTYLSLSFDAQPTDPGFMALNAPDADHGQFVFLTDTSELRWDADGTGISGGVTIAFLDGVHSLSVSDFLLY